MELVGESVPEDVSSEGNTWIWIAVAAVLAIAALIVYRKVRQEKARKYQTAVKAVDENAVQYVRL